MTLLELATLGDADDFASLLLSVGAGGKAAKSSELTPLMWVGSLDWHQNPSVQGPLQGMRGGCTRLDLQRHGESLCCVRSRGFQLTNSDLEGPVEASDVMKLRPSELEELEATGHQGWDVRGPKDLICEAENGESKTSGTWCVGDSGLQGNRRSSTAMRSTGTESVG